MSSAVWIGMLLILILALFGLVFRLWRETTRLAARLAALDARSAATPADASHTAPSNVRTEPAPPIVEGLPPGLPAPEFALPALAGGSGSLASLRATGKPVLLIFWNPDALACAALLPEIANWQRERTALMVAVIAHGIPGEVRAAVGDITIAHLLCDPQGDVAPRYQVWATPTALLIHTDGTVASPLAVGGEAIRVLVGIASGSPVPRHAPTLGADGEMFWLHAGLPRKSVFVHDELLPDGSMVLYHAARQKIMTLNATGALIWECCDGTHAPAQIISEVREVFPDAGAVERDVGALLRQLFENRMIDAVQH